ncbi:MAG TPA: hypothetical protein VIK28_05600 [Sedimentisphaerales bacterium]
MAKNKNSAGEQSSSPKDENSNGEIERRLAALEKSTADLNNRIFDSHKWFVTILFSAVAVVLTVYGVMSRLDVKDSTAAMEKRVESKTSEMQAKVQALVGEALKKPVLEVVTADDQPLEGKTNVVYGGGGDFQIYTVFLKNTGDKRTEPVSIRVSLGASFQYGYNGSHDWEQAPTSEKDFAISFYSTRTTTTIAPGQTVNMLSLPIMGDLSKPALCELEVFYGGEKPVRTRFYISTK